MQFFIVTSKMERAFMDYFIQNGASELETANTLIKNQQAREIWIAAYQAGQADVSERIAEPTRN